MDRRTFLGAVPCGVVVSLAARAATATNVRRIGILSPAAWPPPSHPKELYAALSALTGLAALLPTSDCINRQRKNLCTYERFP
jgi:hypothetical protein